MFLKRVISGAVLAVFFVAIFIVGGYPMAVAALGVSLLGYWELAKALANPTPAPGAERTPLPQEKKFDYMDAIAFVGITLYYVAMAVFGDVVYQFVIVMLFVLAILFVYVFSFPKIPIDRIANVAFSFIYCPVLLSFIYMTREAGDIGKYFVWMIAISSWGCDTCAYLVGITFGKKKVFPLLSPKKSLQGCIGGIVGSGIIGGVYGYIYLGRIAGFLENHHYIYLFTAAMCMIGAVMGMLGDLVASGIKRNKGFKDYSRLIPGHGGVMDRIDSAIATAPMIYVLTLMMIKGYFKL